MQPKGMGDNSAVIAITLGSDAVPMRSRARIP